MATDVSVTSHYDCYCLDVSEESTTGATIRNTGDFNYHYDIETDSGVQTVYIMTQPIEESLETPTEFLIDPSKYPYGMSVSTRTGTYIMKHFTSI